MTTKGGTVTEDELIEAAAKAIADAQNVPFVGVKQRKIARAALEVFESARQDDWEYRDYVVAGFPRPKNVRVERQRRHPATEWEPIPDTEGAEQ